MPAAFALSRFTSLGQYSITVAVAAAMALCIMLYPLYLLKGRWLRVKL